MTDELHPLGELDDFNDLANLPPKERVRMRRLRGWLAERNWSPSQAVAVLCGFDPEAGRNTCAADMAFLPGVYAFYGVSDGSRDPDDLRAMDAGIEEHLTFVRGLGLTTMSPQNAIVKVVAAGISIPWLEAVQADLECRKFLPKEALLEPSAERPIQVANRAKANAFWENDDKHKLILDAGRKEFERLQGSGFVEHTGPNGKPIIASVARAIQEVIADIEPNPKFHAEPRTVERHVKKWLEET